MEKPIKKLISAVVAAVMSLSAVPVAAFASDDLPQTDSFYDTLGYASKSQYVLYSESESSMQLNVNRAVINGNAYTNGNLDAYAGEVLVRGDLFVGKAVNKHEYTILDSYRYFENAQKGVMNDFEDEMTASLGEDYVTHEWWYTYSNPDTTLTDSIYAKSGLQFTGNNVTLGGTYISESYLMISASHALTTAPDSQMNLYCANGNIGIYVGDAQINGIIYAPNGTVQICGSDIEINGLVIAKEIQISAQDFTINEDPTLTMSENAWLYNDARLAIAADYADADNTAQIELISSVSEGEYSIYTFTEGSEPEYIGSTQQDSFTFSLDGVYEDIFVKAQQSFDNSVSIWSNTIKLEYNEETQSFIPTDIDTDSDGLSDLYEYMFLTDISDPDTDDDGLSDFIEVMLTLTDPRYTDTDEDGISDAYEDYDADGLSNIEETQLKTNPASSDTDADGLSDYDEVYVYFTDPVNPDTDDDKITDSDEIALGLDPLSADTDNNGIPDSHELFEQKIENPQLDLINEGNDYELDITLNASGYAQNSLDIEESGFSYIATTNEAVVGKLVNVSYDSSLIAQELSLTFSLSQGMLESERYFPESQELDGINRYAIFHYYEDYSVMLPALYEYDYDNNALIVNTDELGDYFVVDLDRLYYDLGIEPDIMSSTNEVSTFAVERLSAVCYNETEIESENNYTLEEIYQMFDFTQSADLVEIENSELEAAQSDMSYSLMMLSAEPEQKQKIKPVDIVYMIDCSDNLQDNFENVKENIISSAKEISELSENAKFSIISFWFDEDVQTSPWYSDVSDFESYVNGIEQSTVENSIYGEAIRAAAMYDYTSGTKKYAFLIFDEHSQWSRTGSAEEIAATTQLILNNDINLSILYDHSRSSLGEFSSSLRDKSNGYDGTNRGSFYSDIVDHVYENTDRSTAADIPAEDYITIDCSGPLMLANFSGFAPIKVDELENIDGTMVYLLGKYTDSDSDGLTDYAEIDWSNMIYNDLGFHMSDTVSDWLHRIYPAQPVLFTGELLDIRILPIFSNPWNEDTDGDGLNDCSETISISNSIYSNPVLTDSDYDNIPDFSDPYPLQKNNIKEVDWSVWTTVDLKDYMLRRNITEIIFLGVHEVGMFLVENRVLGSAKYHTSIIIFANKESKYYDDPNFINKVAQRDNIHYVTMGAGPGWLLSGDPLTAGFNRDKDAVLGIKSQLTNLTVSDDINDKIDGMLDYHRYYMDTPDELLPTYDLFPKCNSEQNSNSYAAGLLLVSGIDDFGGPRYDVPGYEYPVSPKYFGA